MLDKFGSLILVRHDSPVEKLSDLKGKSFACASRSAFGGWLMAVRELRENGVNPDSNFTSLRELKTHDNVIYAVLNGAVDGGSVRTGTLEKMVQEGKVEVSNFKFINRVPDDFPLLHSTQLYPEYPMAVCQHVPSDVRSLVSKLLYALPPSDPAVTSAKIAGWKEPLEYKPVVECLASIKYGAFEEVLPQRVQRTKRTTPCRPPEAVRQKPLSKLQKGAPYRERNCVISTIVEAYSQKRNHNMFFLRNDNFLPGIDKILSAFSGLLSDGTLLRHCVASLYRVTVGFYLAVLIAIPLGIFLGTLSIRLTGSATRSSSF